MAAKKKPTVINPRNLPLVHEYYKPEIRYITDLFDLKEITEEIESPDYPVVCVDTETSGLDTQNDVVTLFQISPIQGKVYVVDVLAIGEGFWEYATRMLTGKQVVMYNADYDVRILRQFYKDEPWTHIIDLMLFSQLLHQGYSFSHSLGAVVERELDLYLPKDEQASNWVNRPLTKEQILYAGFDVEVMWHLRTKLRNKIKASKRANNALLIELHAQPAILDAERCGMPLNVKKATKLCEALDLEAQQLEESIIKEFDSPKLNIRSPKQLNPILCKYMGISVLDGTSDTILAQFDSPDKPAIKAIRKYRTVSKVKKYIDDLMKNVTDIKGDYGVVRTRFWQLPSYANSRNEADGGTVVGRLSSKSPNLQNPPKDPRIRELFECPPGKRLIGCDWSTLHGRIIAHMAEAKSLKDIFNNPTKDWYIATAQSIVEHKGTDWSSLSDKEKLEFRKTAKAINLGFLFGMYPKRFIATTLADTGIEYSLKDATDFRALFFSLYPELNTFHRQLASNGKYHRVSQTLGGHDIFHQLDNYNNYLNWPVIGTEAEICKIALKDTRELIVRPHNYKAEIANVIHDEILLLVDEDLCDPVFHKGNEVFLTDKGVRFFKKDAENVVIIKEKENKLTKEITVLYEDATLASMGNYRQDMTSPLSKKLSEVMENAFYKLVPDVGCTAEHKIGYNWNHTK